MSNSIQKLLKTSELKVPNGLLRLALRENTGEHCLFLIVCEKYFYNQRKNTGLCTEIYTTFIKSGAPLEINISSTTKKRFLDKLNRDQCLRIAYDEVYGLLLSKQLEKEQSEIEPLHKYVVELENNIINRNPNLSLKEITQLLLKNRSDIEDIDKHEIALLRLLYMIEE